MTKKKTQTHYLEEQASTLLELATNVGIADNYLFCVSYNRLILQQDLLKKLDEDFRQDSSMVKKEYIKGRENAVAHPLIAKINQTIDSANKTTSLLYKLIANANSLQKKPQDLNSAQLEELEQDINQLNQKDFANKWRMSLAEASKLIEQKNNDDFFL